MDDYISRREGLTALGERPLVWTDRDEYALGALTQYDRDVLAIKTVPAAPVMEVVLCKDCLFGHLYIDVVNGESDSWVECRNPDGLNRDVSMDEFCSASIRRQENEEMQEVANLDTFYGEALND